MNFDIIGEITDIETIAVDKSIREVRRLRKTYGSGRGRKLKGIATFVIDHKTACKADMHWLRGT